MRFYELSTTSQFNVGFSCLILPKATEVSLVAVAAALVGVVVSGPTTIRVPLLTTLLVFLAPLLDSGARFVTRLVIMWLRITVCWSIIYPRYRCSESYLVIRYWRNASYDKQWQSLWMEAALTATFLINLPFSSVLGWSSPDSCLLGFACYPYLRAYTTSKLTSRSMECVFVNPARLPLLPLNFGTHLAHSSISPWHVPTSPCR